MHTSPFRKRLCCGIVARLAMQLTIRLQRLIVQLLRQNNVRLHRLSQKCDDLVRLHRLAARLPGSFGLAVHLERLIKIDHLIQAFRHVTQML